MVQCTPKGPATSRCAMIHASEASWTTELPTRMGYARAFVGCFFLCLPSFGGILDEALDRRHSLADRFCSARCVARSFGSSHLSTS